MIEHKPSHSAARTALRDNQPASRRLLDAMPPHGEHGVVLAERLRFGPPETWMGWRRGYGKVSVKIWPDAQAPLPLLRHPGIAPIVECGPNWRVSDWVEGHPLSRHLARAMPLDPLTTLAAIEDAVATLHDTGLAHGDLTPANIIIDGKGAPVLIDWGEITAGTPGWTPPGAHDAFQRDRHALARLAALLVSGPPRAANRP